MHISPHYTLHMDRATDAWGQGTAPQSAGPTISPITLIQHHPPLHVATHPGNTLSICSITLKTLKQAPLLVQHGALSVSNISKGMQSGLVLGWPRNLSFFEKLALHYFGIVHGLTQECKWHVAEGRGTIRHSLVDRFRNCLYKSFDW